MEKKQILDSWKEISHYLKRDIKTCQHWEKELGLPIRRLEDSPRAHVFAYKEELDRWLEERLSREESTQKRLFSFHVRKTKKFVTPFLVVFALVVATGILWRLLTKEEIASPPTDKPSLAVLYFENNTGDETLEYLREALAAWLTTDLSQSRLIHVLSGDRLFSILKSLDLLENIKYSSEDLAAVAKRAGVDHVLRGSYIKIGDNFLITAILHRPQSSEVIRTFEERCRETDEIPSRIDKLTEKIKLDMNLSHKQIAGDIDRDVREITTSSSEAYKYYNEGIRFWHRRDPGEAARFFERAVTVDPEFAMAYYRMGRCYSSLQQETKGNQFHQKAFELSNSVSEKERLLLQARYYFLSLNTYDKAIKALNRCLELYPGDVEAYRQLAYRSVIVEEWDKAIQYGDIIIRNEVEQVQPYQYTAHSYRGKGLFDRGKEVLEYYRDHISNNATVHWYLAIHHLLDREYESALDEVNQAIFLDPTLLLFFTTKAKIFQGLGDCVSAEKELLRLQDTQDFESCSRSDLYLYNMYLLQGKFAKAKLQLEKGIERSQELGEKGLESDRRHDLAYLYLRLGNFQEALKESSRAWRIHIGRSYLQLVIRTLHQKGLVHLKMKQVQDAQMVADELNDLIEPIADFFAPKMKSWYYSLMGMIELEQENFPGAIACFNKALSFLSFPPPSYFQDFHGLFIEPLAMAYYRTGDLKKARKEYEKIIALPFGRYHHGDIYAKSFYQLGKICEQQGDRARAIENYEKFLVLWKDADPGLPEVADARKRLKALQ